MSDKSIERLRVLELYSGIGGMHWALKESGVPFEVVMAIDINTTANSIYQHNFPEANLNSFGIEKLTLKKLKSLHVNAILMSPPCQPFSRCGKKGDCDDVRTKSFLHVLQLLQQIDTKPAYILVENVKGFEVSRTRQMLVDALQLSHYDYQEYLLNPLQFGIPNSRLRYYLIAKLKHLPRPLIEANEILYSIPELSTPSSQDSHNLPNRGYASSKSSPLVSHHSNSVQTCSSPHTNSSTATPPNSHEQNATSCKKCSENENDTNELGDIMPVENNKSSLGDICVNNCDTTTIDDGSGSVSGMDTGGGDGPVSIKPGGGRKTADISTELSDLMDAGRNMRFCEDLDALVDENSRPLSDFMEFGVDEACLVEHLLVSDKDLRQFVVMDVVLPQLKKSTCFTKRYGHYVEGAGSLVQMSSSVQDTRAASCFKSKAVELKKKHDWGEEELTILRKLKLRYFSPREVANLLCFPPDFEFPPGVSDIQKYRCLGNSLNVHVVARLIRLLTSGDLGSPKPVC